MTNPDNILGNSGVLLFASPGCSHCPTVRTRSEEVSQSSPSINFAEVSAPDRRDLTTSLKVRAAPTSLAFHNGVEVDRVVGTANVDELQRLFRSAAGHAPGRPRRISTENRAIRTGAGLTLVLAGIITQVIWLVLIGAVLCAAGWHDYLTAKRVAST